MALGIPGLVIGLFLALNLILGLYLYGLVGVRTIYLGLFGMALTVASGWGILSVVGKIVKI